SFRKCMENHRMHSVTMLVAEDSTVYLDKVKQLCMRGYSAPSQSGEGPRKAGSSTEVPSASDSGRSPPTAPLSPSGSALSSSFVLVTDGADSESSHQPP